MEVCLLYSGGWREPCQRLLGRGGVGFRGGGSLKEEEERRRDVRGIC
jgi:hypothetical protein